MINNRVNRVDLYWSLEGDLAIKNGDLRDTSDNFGRSFIQEVTSRIGDTIGDWNTSQARSIGSHIADFEGEPNTKTTGEKLRADLSYALTKDGFLTSSDFNLTPVPVGPDQILIRLEFSGVLTDSPGDSKLFLNVIYDLTGKGPYIVR